jgi:hypothetical protein
MCSESNHCPALEGGLLVGLSSTTRSSDAGIKPLEPLRSVYATSFVQIRIRCGISWLVTTYQSVATKVLSGELHLKFIETP